MANINLPFFVNLFFPDIEGILEFEIGSYPEELAKGEMHVIRIQDVGEFLIPVDTYRRIREEVNLAETQDPRVINRIFLSNILQVSCEKVLLATSR